MIKICHMTSVHQAEDVRIFYKECTSLVKAGYKVYLVAPGDSYEKNGIHIVGVGAPPAGRLARMIFFAKKVYQTALAVDANIYHFHDPELLPYGLRLKKRRKMVIFDCHENYTEAIREKNYISIPLRKIVYHFYNFEEKRVCRRIDGVITVTPNIVEHFQKIALRTVQIANFPILRERPFIAKQENTIIFAGGITADWNHHILLRAMEKLPTVQYLLYGVGSENYLRELQAFPAWERVHYFGEVPHLQILDQLAGAQIGVALTSYSSNSNGKEGTMGNTKIFEEMMMGLPVVCTNYVLWDEFVTRYHCGICVDPENVEEIVSAVQFLLDHPEEARQMGENGRRAVKEVFNWEAEEKKLLALYEDILNEKREVPS